MLGSVVWAVFAGGCASQYRSDPGFKSLIADDLSNCDYKPGSWKMKNAILTRSGNGDNSNIWTKKQYSNFILDLDFKIAKGTNSGVIFRSGTTKGWDWVQQAIEVQIFDDTGVSKHSCGAIYDCLGPSTNAARWTGWWNHMTITAKDNLITVMLNGKQIIDMDVDRWTQANRNPDGTKNKFKKPVRDFPRKGFIGLQDHGHPVWFKNVRIKEL